MKVCCYVAWGAGEGEEFEGYFSTMINPVAPTIARGDGGIGFFWNGGA